MYSKAHWLMSLLFLPFMLVGADRPSRAAYPSAKLRPADAHTAAFIDGFWKPRISTSLEKGWFDAGNKLDQHGHFEPFRVIAQKRNTGSPRGPNNDEFVYKWMEAGGYYAGHPSGGEPGARVRSELARIIQLVLSIQTPEGYINSYFGNPITASKVKPPFHALNRFEFYNFGHLTQAAIALSRSTGDRTFLDAAIRFADLIVTKFGAPSHLPYEQNRGPIHQRTEHPNHEMAMVELYRATGDQRYLSFARQTLDEYNFCARWQIDGHAVQETLLNAGAVDVYLETGDAKLLAASERLWEDMVRGRMYLTGGVGSRFKSECFGDKYELPNKGYAETCASIGSFLWAHRLLLATGEGRYGDLMERLMYNGIACGLSLSGTEYFYTNPLASDGIAQEDSQGPPRKAWFRTPCCPPNLARFLASLGGYLYATSGDGISVILYGASEGKIRFRDQEVAIRQETQYPWEGRIKLIVNPKSPAQFALRLRIPSWTQGRLVASDLYTYLDSTEAPYRLLVNGKPLDAKPRSGFVSIERNWRPGDTVVLALPMPVRRVVAHESVLNLRGHAAVERGPVVYCVEGVDHGGSIRDLALPDAAELRAEFEPGLLGGVAVVRGSAGNGTNAAALTAVPYAVWANRGAGEMAVWLPRDARAGPLRK